MTRYTCYRASLDLRLGLVDLGGRNGHLDVLLGEMHLGGESGVGLPLSGGTGSALFQHLIDLLQSKTLGLGNEEEGEEEGDDAETAPHEEDLGAQLGRVRLVGNEVRSDDTDDAVPEPVGGGGETDTTGTDGEREDLANDDPGARTPGNGEGGDVQADESDHGAGGVGVVFRGLSSGNTDDSDDVLEDDHESSTTDEQLTASDLLDQKEGGRGGQDVDEGRDKRDQEGVADRAELLEEDRTEVEDEVDTSELLHHLHEDTHSCAAGVGRGRADLALEAGHP